MPQREGRAIVGVLTGTRLWIYAAETISWRDWRTENPCGWVLSRDTGFPRDYGTNPYVYYDSPDGPPAVRLRTQGSVTR